MIDPVGPMVQQKIDKRVTSCTHATQNRHNCLHSKVTVAIKSIDYNFQIAHNTGVGFWCDVYNYGTLRHNIDPPCSTQLSMRIICDNKSFYITA